MRVPRITKETAQLIIIKLKNTISKIHFETPVGESALQKQVEEVMKVLMNLGASESSAQRAMAEAQKILGSTARVEDLVRLALRYV
jgi:Holliday junction resolvasome RuvABC DNA-binding subunit